MISIVASSSLGEIVARQQARSSALIADTAQALADEIGQAAPRGATGRLSEVEARPEGNGDWGVYGEFYWWFQEYGTVDQPPRPFVHPICDAARPVFLRDLQGTWW